MFSGWVRQHICLVRFGVAPIALAIAHAKVTEGVSVWFAMSVAPITAAPITAATAAAGIKGCVRVRCQECGDHQGDQVRLRQTQN